MFMNEVMIKTGLTRKAIEYYEEKGFVTPEREENNYRVYSDGDIEVLNKISIFRKLGCSIDEIKSILEDKNQSSLATIIRDKEIKSQLDHARVETLKLLLAESDAGKVKEQLDSIDQQETIYTKLMRAFPGYFGQIFFLSYQPFLGEALEESKVKYYQEYTEFLDNMPEFAIDEEEKIALEEASKYISNADIEETNKEKIKAIENADDWLDENREMLESYRSFKESEDYRNHPIVRLQERMKEHMEASGYYEIALPLMRQFSPSYDAYYQQLLVADQKFLMKHERIRRVDEQ